MKLHSRMARLWCGASLVALLAVGAASGQEAEQPDGSGSLILEPIIVMGEKLARSIFDTASSVSILQTPELDEHVNDKTVADAIAGTPNVTYTDSVGAPVIRGQDTQGPNYGASAFMGGTMPRATVNLDGHYQNFYEYAYGSTTIWDVDSIEVFRGPQTSSQGANSIAGAIIVNTKDPSFTPEGAVQLQYGSRNMRRVSAMASGQIATDLAARVALDYSARDTFITYTNPAFVRTDQDFSYRNARAKLLWRPADLPGFEAKLTFSHTQSNRPTIEAATIPYEDLNSATASMPNWDQRGNTTVLDISHDFGNDLRIFNQTTYTDLHVDRVIEPETNGAARVDSKNLSNETRLTFGNDDTAISGVAGIYVARNESSDWLNNRGISEFDDTRNTLGIWTETSWRIATDWTLTGGLRYQRDHIEREGTSNFAAEPMDYDETFTAWLPKLSLAWQATPGLTFGALYSKGYNPGGINVSFATADYIPFDKETVDNYELFARASLLDDRLLLTGNVFYNDFKNSQRLLNDYLNGVPFGVIVVNADKAEAWGLELEADYRLTDDLRIRAGAGLLRTEIGAFSDALGNSFEGNEFSRSPGHMFSLGVDWNIRPDLRLTGDLRHTDGYYSNDQNNPAFQIDSYTVANARLTWTPRDQLEVFAFVNNIFDERTPTWKLEDRSVGGIAAAMLEPREIGIGVKMTF